LYDVFSAPYIYIYIYIYIYVYNLGVNESTVAISAGFSFSMLVAFGRHGNILAWAVLCEVGAKAEPLFECTVYNATWHTQIQQSEESDERLLFSKAEERPAERISGWRVNIIATRQPTDPWLLLR
jgi:hypothetical protein